MTDTASFSTLLIKVGDGEDPEQFDHPCLINMDRSISMSVNFQEDEIPDCDNPDAPASVVVQPRSFAVTISGTGKLHLPDLETWMEWARTGALKNCEIEIGGVGGQKLEGGFYLETFEISGPYKQVLEVSVALRPREANTLTQSEIAA